MGILDTILSVARRSAKESIGHFGRYSDSHKSDEKYNHWDQALTSYEIGNHYDCFIHVLEFLKDEKNQNLEYSEDKGVITFQFYQGSKLITGTADRLKLRAEAKIVRADRIELGFSRLLIEQNFELEYCRFALTEDNLVSIVFDTYAVDASPYKVYYALRELASHADKKDDILLAKYTALSKIDDQHISAVDPRIIDIKYSYVRKQIQTLLERTTSGALSIDKYPSSLCYLVLDLIYKVDYLIQPEGETLDMIEEIHRTYLLSKNEDIKAKNQKVIHLLKQWLQRSREDFGKEIYNVISTFGVTMPSGHDKLSECIDSELPNLDWYYENQYDAVALAIPSYLAGFLMFSYALPDPDKEFIHLLYEILERDYFVDMGFPNSYIKKGKLYAAPIRKRILQIQKKYEDRFPNLDPDIEMLSFQNPVLFAKSYLTMIGNLDMTRVDLRDNT